jgi:aspartyl-tRNA(Asn)/glutamyl-tRNA(Gln) amidotransferase subunit C
LTSPPKGCIITGMAHRIDEKAVRHVALLGRIELTDEQVAVFGRQLADIVAYVDKLQELDTTGVEPMAHALPIHNVLAEDIEQPCLTPEQALANAPQRQGDLYKVPKVIGESQ